jgi:hypothetical protein
MVFAGAAGGQQRSVDGQQCSVDDDSVMRVSDSVVKISSSVMHIPVKVGHDDAFDYWGSYFVNQFIDVHAYELPM